MANSELGVQRATRGGSTAWLWLAVFITAAGAPTNFAHTQLLTTTQTHAVGNSNPSPANAAPRATDLPHLAGKRAVATRLDIALELLKLETALADAAKADTLSDATQVRVNKQFDSLTGLFFAGRNAEAIDKLQQLVEAVSGKQRTVLQKALDASKLEIEPAIWPRDGAWPTLAGTSPLGTSPPADSKPVAPDDEPVARLRLRQLHGGGDIKLLAGKHINVLAVRSGESPATAPQNVTLGTLQVPENEGDNLRVELLINRKVADALAASLPVENLRLTLAITGETEAKSDAALLQIVPRQLAAFVADARARFAQQQAVANSLATIASLASPLVRATLLSRIDLASQAPRSSEAGRSLLSLGQLQADITRELPEVAAGRDPYFARPGTWQFTLGQEAGDAPVWVHGPSRGPANSAAGSATQRPGLLIALHGAGGDEAMFPLSYGGGAIRQLCEANNLVLFSPKTEPLMTSAALLDALVARAAAHYNIDPTRIYIIGHSMGAMATASLATQRPLTIAAAACIAGGPLGQPPTGLARLPDLYIVGAELDGLVSPKRLETVTNRWAEAGLPVKFKLAPGLGHTLSVGHELPQAVAFLVNKSLPGGLPAEPLIELPVGNKSSK